MKKNLNKLATLALTGMMVAGMSFGAMAATGTTWVSTNPSILKDGKATIIKQIKLINHPVSGANEAGKDVPDVTYTYTVTPASGNELGKIGDYQVEAGPSGSLKSAEKDSLSIAVSFTDNDNITEKTTYGIVEKNFDVEFDATKFEQAGVYRYKIVESNPTTTDVSYDDTDNTLYLDVYVDSSKDITAVVLLNSAGDRTGVTGTDKDEKKPGFVVTDDGGQGETKGDTYNTYDLDVKKVIDGNDSVKGLTFNFEVALTKGADGVDKVVDSWSGKASSSTAQAEEKGTVGQNGYGTVSYSLSNNGEIVIKNIPASATFTVKETNSSVNAFVVTASGATLANAGSDNSVTLASNNGTAQTVSTGFVANGTAAAKTITITNKYSSTPVTGVAMDIAPYAAMVLGAGAFAGIFLGGKRRKAEDED